MNEFKVGDRVRHALVRGSGTVTKVGNGMCLVRFDRYPSPFKVNNLILCTQSYLTLAAGAPFESGSLDLEPEFGNRSQFEVQKAFVRMLVEKGGVPNA